MRRASSGGCVGARIPGVKKRRSDTTTQAVKWATKSGVEENEALGGCRPKVVLEFDPIIVRVYGEDRRKFARTSRVYDMVGVADWEDRRR